MAVPQVTEYTGIAPSRTGQTQAQFSSNGDDMNTYYSIIAESMNLSISGINLAVIGINNNSISASASATSAAISANFLGKWSDLTGAQSKGSIFHIGELWQLLVDVADITATEPSSSNSQYSNILGEIKAAEIALNVSSGSVISYLDTTTAIPAYIFAADQQKTYSVPSGAVGKFISDVTTDQLTTSDASTYTLILQKPLGVSGQGGDLTQTLPQLQAIVNRDVGVGVSGTGGDLTQTLAQTQAILDNAALKTNNGLAGNYEVVLDFGSYTSGTFTYPNSHVQSDYDCLVIAFDSSSATARQSGASGLLTKEHIATHPSDWEVLIQSDRRYVYVQHASTSSFLIGAPTAISEQSCVTQIIGYLKEGVS